MYKFSYAFGDRVHKMELACIYHFGVEAWSGIVNNQYGGKFPERTEFAEFLCSMFRPEEWGVSIIENPTDKYGYSTIICTVLEKGEECCSLSNLSEEKVTSICDIAYNLKNIKHENLNDIIQNLGISDYIGVEEYEDEVLGREYVLVFNKKYDDVYYLINKYDITASKLAAGISICLIGKHFEKSKYNNSDDRWAPYRIISKED